MFRYRPKDNIFKTLGSYAKNYVHKVKNSIKSSKNVKNGLRIVKNINFQKIFFFFKIVIFDDLRAIFDNFWWFYRIFHLMYIIFGIGTKCFENIIFRSISRHIFNSFYMWLHVKSGVGLYQQKCIWLSDAGSKSKNCAWIHLKILSDPEHIVLLFLLWDLLVCLYVCSRFWWVKCPLKEVLPKD